MKTEQQNTSKPSTCSPEYRYAHPANSSTLIRIFYDESSVCDHIQKHILGEYESLAWWPAFDPEGTRVNIKDGKVRYAHIREIEAGNMEVIRHYYSFCADCIELSANEARCLKWHISSRGVTVAMGITGILMIVEGYMKTAFFPGFGDPSRQSTFHDSSKRQFSEYDAKPHLIRSWKTSQRKKRAAHQRSWDTAQRLYYKVFKKCVRFVRSQHHDSLDITGQRNNDYGLARKFLPSMGRLKFEDWNQLRIKCDENRKGASS